ncbi:putative short chain dehydrogenase/reductase [Cryphonectria parasitica EP155]|uniref:Short chain dehydrogenase/reductase n=1 Tax=Cryphonectria parasitica (strain ATCC 38755 / EP155) TaxID=660469 RepID=A0A9P4XXV3_CRYP1|nr:putative short chain dehydrogenase/reductase [Cryphonectria parasitica EP155]KAF3763003.1 putative short chain dehydrogenase/reductase [Cryphonectria parasitica EP155]
MAPDKKIVLITGANSGIGLETVVCLSQASPDYHIILCARTVDKGNKALQEVKASHGDSLKSPISVLQLDVTDAQSIEAAKEHIEKEFGRLDVLVNNAAILIIPSQQPMAKIELLRTTFETNVFGPWLLTDALEPLLQKSANPLVINVSSDQGSITRKLDPTNPGAAIPGEHYRASKSALNMLAACQRYSYKEWGCKVCAFNPGFCVTNLTGEKGRQTRIEHGARPARDAAEALVDVIAGKRDADLEKNGMVDLDGGILPW